MSFLYRLKINFKNSFSLESYDIHRIIERVNRNGLNYKTEVPKSRSRKLSILLNNENMITSVINRTQRDQYAARYRDNIILMQKQNSWILILL